MSCQIRIEKKKRKICSFLKKYFFFVKDNTKRKGQYTGWVNKVVILSLIHGNYRI